MLLTLNVVTLSVSQMALVVRRSRHVHCIVVRLIVQTLVFSRSYLHRQVSPPETLVVKGGTTWARNDR